MCVCLTQTIGKYVPKFFSLALSLSRFLADITSETLSHTDTCTHDHHHPSSIRSMELLKHHIKSMESLNCLKFSDYTFYVVRHVFSISTAFAMDWIWNFFSICIGLVWFATNWFGLVWFDLGFGVTWLGSAWFSLVWLDLVQLSSAQLSIVEFSVWCDWNFFSQYCWYEFEYGLQRKRCFRFSYHS